ncbi:hypothetical protein BX666DRAFT_684430 [Dichotomocladium elegans]|nr:hypothetical protein BX666DRAFT_684430 [Dichotomocladium elegans]
MTTAVAPSAPETDFQQRELEVLARRTPPTQETDPGLQRHNSTRSQHAGLERKKHQSQESLRRPNERRKVMRIGNYVVNRKTIGAGSMGKVKLATCLTEGDRQQSK